ncbi:hypothetical protein LA313_04390 [Salinimicrobium sp. ASW11-47]|nr:hypothetical protein [Salinimicrobium sediminilitoris]
MTLFLVLSGCKNDDREMEVKTSKIDSLTQELNRQQELKDSLVNLREIDYSANDYSIFFGKEFEDIDNPEEHIVNALKNKEDLIPLKAVLGGSMEFRKVQVISEDWVLAIYDDGHVQGKSIFEYELQEDGEVEFNEIASQLPE